MTINWKKVTIKSDATVREAMEVLSNGTLQIALVIEGKHHLEGTVTDGDIRRGLLKGKSLDTPVSEVMNPNPTTGLIEEGQVSWQRTMHRHTLRHLPLLDADGCIVGLTQYKLPVEPTKANPVVLMVGGLGTRLRPLTNKMPKPLIKVGSKPVLETIIENFAEQGFTKIFLCIRYMGEDIRNYFGNGSRWNVDITYLEESEPLGTAGALSLLPTQPSEPLIVMNGDLLTKVDFVRLLDFHKKQHFSATMAMREYSHQIPYGVLELSEGYKLKALTEKPVQRHYVNAGIYILEPDTLKHVPTRPFDMPTLFEQLISEGLSVGCFPLRDYWIDIGRLEDLEKAHDDFVELFE